MESGLQRNNADPRCWCEVWKSPAASVTLVVRRRGLKRLQGHSRLARVLFTKTYWRVMCICTLGAHRSRWQHLWLSDAAQWTARLLEVLLLRLQSGLHVLQAEAATTRNRCRSGTVWCTSRLCPTYDLKGVCTRRHAGGARSSSVFVQFNWGICTWSCPVMSRGCCAVVGAVSDPRIAPAS